MKREISLEEILIKQQDSTINTDIFNIVDELTILLVQDNDLNPDQLKVAHRKFNHLRDIKEKIQGNGGFEHDINTVIGQVLGSEGNFIAHRKFIQNNPELKQEYKKNISNEVKTIELVDKNISIGDILSELTFLHADFGNALDTKNLDINIINKIGELSVLGIAYNLYNNASRFNTRDGDIIITINNLGSFVFITSYNHSSQEFNTKNKKNIINGAGDIVSELGNNAINGQGIYLSDLSNKLKDINGFMQILDTPSKTGGHHIDVMIIIPYEDIKK